VLIHTDFSENYNHKRQTVYTSMIYYNLTKPSHSPLPALSKPYVVVSDYMRHDKYAVAVFNKAILDDFKARKPDVGCNELHFQSDGAAQHFKQKFTLCNLTLLGIPASWHFSATSQKECIDGIGGSLKRRVNEKAISNKLDLNSSQDFSSLTQKVCLNITVIFISSEVV